MPSRRWQVSSQGHTVAAILRRDCRTGCEVDPKKAAAPPATPRHPNHSLPLLPSGPGGVCELSSRGDRRGHHRRCLFLTAPNLVDRRIYHSKIGGESGIRTRDTFDRIHTFQACSFNHSDTSPCNLFHQAIRPDKGSYAEKSKTTRTAAGWPLASARGEAQDEPNNPASSRPCCCLLQVERCPSG